MTVLVISLDPRVNNHNIVNVVGPIPHWLNEEIKEKAAVQLNANYRHGGGWRPFGKDKFVLNRDTFELTYPGDPVFKPLAMMTLRDEKIFMYQSSIVCIVQPDGSFEVARMD